MQTVLLISLGAIVGANLRYFLAQYVAAAVPSAFPYGTLVINVTGSLILGFFLVLSTDRIILDPRWRSRHCSGLSCGGYTTYSSFAYENLCALFEQGRWLSSALNILSTNILCLLGVTTAGAAPSPEHFNLLTGPESLRPIIRLSMGTEKPKADLLPGTLDMMVLKILTRGHLHGYAIAQLIQQLSDDLLQVEEGSLYPALQRLELNGWIEGEWGLSANNRRARFYTLTLDGRKHLNAEAARYRQVIGAVARVMEFA